MLLKGKRVLITGASQGIGKAIATFCHQQGAHLFLHARNEQSLNALRDELGDNVYTLALDLHSSLASKQLMQAAVETMGGLDGLVNNAGIFPRSRIDDVSSELFNEVMTVNVRKPLLLCQAAIKQFKEQQSPGSIVNIGSINAYCGQPDLLIYSMSKGALMTMTRNLADAHGIDRIRVNQLNVGWTATETEHEIKSQELGENWQQKIPEQYAPKGEILKPEQIAPHVGFWLSELSSPVSGAIYEVEQYPVIGRNRISDLSFEGE